MSLCNQPLLCQIYGPAAGLFMSLKFLDDVCNCLLSDAECPVPGPETLSVGPCSGSAWKGGLLGLSACNISMLKADGC